MALTVTIIEKYSIGDRMEVVADVVFDSSYALGGEAVTAANFGFDLEIKHVACGVARSPLATDLAVVLDFDKANLKLVAFWGDNANAAAGPLVEVPATTNLSAYTARVVAKGR